MERMRGEMNSQKGYVLIIDTNGDVTSIIDDAREQPWLSSGYDPQPKGLPFMPAPSAKAGARRTGKLE